jgi:ADP-ribosylglycohydrolase
MDRARLSLDGLSIGDAFGSQFFLPGAYAKHCGSRTTPEGIWGYTDDTEMALGIVEVLERHGRIDQSTLAEVFARRYVADTYRGYGTMAHRILTAIATGTPWRDAAYSAFGGQGSMGNGSAMRVAPLGAYFADDLDRLCAEAAVSLGRGHPCPPRRKGRRSRYCGGCRGGVAILYVIRRTCTGPVARICTPAYAARKDSRPFGLRPGPARRN